MPNKQSSTDDFMINPQDFESVRLKIKVSNTTTRTELKKEAVVQLLELLEHGMVLELPFRSCAMGHHLNVEIELLEPGQKKPNKFVSTSIVAEITHVNPEVDRVSITLVQCDDMEWHELNRKFKNRQHEIENFFTAARGH